MTLPTDPDAWRSAPAGRPRRWDVGLAIAAGGAVGGLLRRSVNVLVPAADGGFPWATFAENVAGCLLLAVLLVYVSEVWPPRRYVRPFLGIGVLGSFTTFSTFTNETRALVDAGQAPLAFGYVAASLLAGLAATYVGLWGARRVAGVARNTRRTA